VALLGAASVWTVLDLRRVRLDVLAGLRIPQILQPGLIVWAEPDPLIVVRQRGVRAQVAAGWLAIEMLGPGVRAGQCSWRGMIGPGASRGPTAGWTVALDGILAMRLLVACAASGLMMLVSLFSVLVHVLPL
jgi:hypothetical protein